MTQDPIVLVLRALGLGDLLTSVPHLRALRRAYPEHRLILATPKTLAPMVELIGDVDEVLDTGGLEALRWDRTRPDLAVNLHGCGPESTRDLQATKPKRILTHHHPDLSHVEGPGWRDDLHEVERWARLLEYGSVDVDRADLDLEPPDDVPVEPGTVVIHPGAGAPARCWPVERFATVAETLAAGGHRVVVTAGPNEEHLAAAVADAAGLPAGSVLDGPDLRSLAGLVAGADLVICGDTGIGHLATAYRTPSVLLFGPTPPQRWGPPTDRPHHVVLWSGTIGNPHADRPDPGLLRIGAEQVIAEAQSLLKGIHASGHRAP